MGAGGRHHAPATLPVGRRPGSPCTGGWAGPWAGLDGCGKSLSHQDLIPRPSIPQQVALLTMLSQPTLHYMYIPYIVLSPFYMYMVTTACVQL
jgi:hypothetical protein